MFFKGLQSATVAAFVSCLLLTNVEGLKRRDFPSKSRRPHQGPRILERQVPAEPTNVTKITSPSGATIRYKEPGKEGICETTPGVNSYSGYVDLGPETHMFFWFFDSRRNPAEDPITLWLNGGPGSDSLIGLFEGINFRYH